MASELTASGAWENIKTELGPDIVDILENRKDWSDLMINPNGTVFLDTDEKKQIDISYSDSGLFSAAFILAAYLHKPFNEKEGQQLDGTLPTTSIRALFLCPPTVRRITCVFRRLNTINFVPSDLIKMGTITKEQSDMLIRAIREKRNIIFAGATGSGKTTILNAYLSQFPYNERIWTVEDSEELNVSQPNCVSQTVNDFMTYQASISSFLRGAPERLIIGEMRYGEQCLQTIKMWNTGHPGGMSTIHANSCEDTIYRMRQLCQEVSMMSASELDEMIKHILDVIVYIKRIPGTKKRVVTDIWTSEKNFSVEV